MRELVSVVIPTYKRSDTLLRAVNSVLNQTYENIEVVIVDDNDPNDEFSIQTQQNLRDSLNDKRIRYILQKKHINGAVARNVGIEASNGEYIAFLDDDDEWLPDKVRKQVHFLIDKDVEGVSCLYDFYKEGELLRKGTSIKDDNLMPDILSRRVQLLAGSSFLCKKRTLKDSGMFDESFTRHQDLQMLIDFLQVGTIRVLQEHLVKIHTDSIKNRPNTRELIEVKNHFLTFMRDRIGLLSSKEQKRVYSAHYFEIVVKALNEKKFHIAIQYLAKIGINIDAYRDVFERYKERK